MCDFLHPAIYIWVPVRRSPCQGPFSHLESLIYSGRRGVSSFPRNYHVAYLSSSRRFARVETRPQHPRGRARTRARSSARAESQPSAFDGMSQSPLHAVYGAPATTHGSVRRQRLLAEVVGESPDPPREPLSRGAHVASALVAFAVVGCAVIGMLSLVGGAPLARLGAIGDTGWARELTPEEVELGSAPSAKPRTPPSSPSVTSPASAKPTCPRWAWSSTISTRWP